DAPRIVLARYGEQNPVQCVDEFSYECCGRRVDVASRVDSRGKAPTNRGDVAVWTLAAAPG
ncbi:MAG: hypothetical protein JW940_19630, partial [Polyangiaceae bacterium]|nr:hypothetical protein [Polyangiaceae bacterium]